MTTRAEWIDILDNIITPPLHALETRTLRATMPTERGGSESRPAPFGYLELLGRMFNGIAPWLELSDEKMPERERALHARARRAMVAGFESVTDPASPDYIRFDEGGQNLVDAAFLAQGFLRSWDNVWTPLPDTLKTRLVDAFLATRTITPPFNNWLLFSATIEAFLARAGVQFDGMRIDYALRQHEQWYVGDGLYCDGTNFHADYYNSFVIQPMMHDVLNVMSAICDHRASMRDTETNRLRRLAAHLERMISPEGTLPPLGRSLAYRFGILHALAQVALEGLVPISSAPPNPAAMRCAMTAALKRFMCAPGTFDANGWLTIGFCGAQNAMGEGYVTTGSTYLCTFGFLPLGLPETDAFWSQPDEDWTSRKLYAGIDMPCDHAL